MPSLWRSSVAIVGDDQAGRAGGIKRIISHESLPPATDLSPAHLEYLLLPGHFP